MRVITSRRGVPFFKSMSIKCQWCNWIFWSTQVTVLLRGHPCGAFLFLAFFFLRKIFLLNRGTWFALFCMSWFILFTVNCGFIKKNSKFFLPAGEKFLHVTLWVNWAHLTWPFEDKEWFLMIKINSWSF